jgi:hypothetical protein
VICASATSHSFPVFARVGFCLGQESEPDQRVVQLVGVGGIWPCLLAHARDRRLIKAADFVSGFRIEPPPAHHGLRAALLKGGIIEVGVRPGGEHLAGKRRRLGQIPCNNPDRAGLDVAKQALQALDIIAS